MIAAVWGKTCRHRGKLGRKKLRESNVMLQQILQLFVMTTFISTMLKPFPITSPGTGETGSEETREGKGHGEKNFVEL